MPRSPKERDTVKDMVSESVPEQLTRKSRDETVQVDLTPLAKQMLHAEVEGKKACLLVLDGMDVGTLIPLDLSSAIVGRSSRCDIILKDDGISRKHAKVDVMKKDRLVIEDLSSTNGTFVGGKRIKKATLKPGDKVLFGRRSLLRFVLEDKLDRLYQEEMYASSTRDGLTGVHNKKYAKQRITTDLSYARRHNTPFTLIMFEIDQFREVNYTYGHQTGDQILVTVAQVVGEMIREEDVFGRWSGEQFILISNGIDLAGGKALSERIRKKISTQRIRALNRSGDVLKITASVGVVTVKENAPAEHGKVLSSVEDNLSLAKQKGQDRVISSQII
jgi:two-component system cell cycle response regulator